MAVLVSGMVFGSAANLWAQPQQSANFAIQKSVLDAGGGVATSANFGLISAYGQPSPTGVQASTNFTLSGGFLNSMFSVSPLSPIQALVIKPMVPNVVLYWPPVNTATGYEVYRSTDPRFVPGPMNLLGTTSDTTFTDNNIVGLTVARNYYIVTALRSSGSLVASEPGVSSEVEATESGRELMRR